MLAGLGKVLQVCWLVGCQADGEGRVLLAKDDEEGVYRRRLGV